MKKGQDESPEKELDVNGPARPVRLRKDKRGASVRTRTAHRKSKIHGGIHERGNKRVNW